MVNTLTCLLVLEFMIGPYGENVNCGVRDWEWSHRKWPIRCIYETDATAREFAALNARKKNSATGYAKLCRIVALFHSYDVHIAEQT